MKIIEERRQKYKKPTFCGRELLPMSVIEEACAVILWTRSMSCGTMTAIWTSFVPRRTLVPWMDKYMKRRLKSILIQVILNSP